MNGSARLVCCWIVAANANFRFKHSVFSGFLELKGL